MNAAHNKGFTLVEVMIALSIAVVAAGYMAQMIASTNKVTAAGKQTFIATNLAQEGLELTRKERDNAWLQDESPEDRADWADSICLNGESPEKITLGDDTLEYTRDININCDNADKEPAFVEVTSTVSWIGQEGQDKQVSLKESLYNWYE